MRPLGNARQGRVRKKVMVHRVTRARIEVNVGIAASKEEPPTQESVGQAGVEGKFPGRVTSFVKQVK